MQCADSMHNTVVSCSRSLMLPAMRGFTLLELMVTLAIAIILASIAAPSFRTMLASQRIQAASSDLNAHLMLARSEAIKRNASVTVQSVQTGGKWEGGWQIVTGTPATLIKVQEAYPNIAITSGVTVLTYNRNGRVASTGSVDFKVSDPATSAPAESRCVTVTVTGMPITKKGSC